MGCLARLLYILNFSLKRKVVFIFAHVENSRKKQDGSLLTELIFNIIQYSFF